MPDDALFSEPMADARDPDNRSGFRHGFQLDVWARRGYVGVVLSPIGGSPSAEPMEALLELEQAERLAAGLREALTRAAPERAAGASRA